MFIAMNQFKINTDRAADFESAWKKRESHLQDFDGFVQFSLLRGDEAGDYLSHTVWKDRAAFLAWAQSDAFVKAHSEKMPEGVFADHPRARFYDSVVVETNAVPAH